MFRLVVKGGCHLCDEAEDLLHAAGIEFQPVALHTLEGKEEYRDLIPLLLDGRQIILKWPFSRDEIECLRENHPGPSA